jgi:hypothetical protein
VTIDSSPTEEQLAMDTWQGPVRGWQELVGSWVFLAAFALLFLAAVTVNAMAHTHPAVSRGRAAAARAADRGVRRLWALTAPRAAAVLLAVTEVTARRLRSVRRTIGEQWSAGRRTTAPDATADPRPAPATS